jgi:hypothetical protein
MSKPIPVAWMVYTMDGQSAYVTDNPTDIKSGQQALPLYTAPPRREWVGLTDEEVWEILWETQSAELDAHGDVGSRKKSLCSIAIEAKLREKNT